jgi:uncharacterized membrane-anchored protein
VRKLVAILAGLVVLAVVNWSIYEREQLLAEGRVVVLPLAPVDPRSLMQGDYMALRFAVADDATRREPGQALQDGRIVVALDPHDVGTYVRHDDGSPLAESEAILRYRVRNGEVKFATNAYFFQEGEAERYAQARFGELRVAPDGDAILTGLRGEDLGRLGPPPGTS